jgi:tetratricopeptide (TPR) repeat protein
VLKIEKTVFISYRRTNIWMAIAVHKHLTTNGYDVFFDYETIQSGDFEQILLNNIESRAHFIVILTPSALANCNDPNDWLRREIEHALTHKRNIIPLTFEGFNYEDMIRYLPDHISVPLKRYNGLDVPASYFQDAMCKLETRLNIPLDTILHPPMRRAKAEAVRQQNIIDNEPPVMPNQLEAEQLVEQSKGLILASSFDHALSLIEKALEVYPAFAEGYACRAWVKVWLKRYDEALADVEIALDQNPDNATAYFARGNLHREQGNYELAIADYDMAIRLNPSSTVAYNNRGVSHEAINNYEKALSDYSMALRCNPYYTKSRINRGELRLKTADINGALQDFSETIRIEPSYFTAWYFRGLAHVENGDYYSAIYDFTECLRLNPDNIEAHYSRGYAKRKLGDYVGAISDYTQVIDVTTDHADAYTNRGEAKLGKHDYAGAIADFEAALRIEPNLQAAKENLRIARTKNRK